MSGEYIDNVFEDDEDELVNTPPDFYNELFDLLNSPSDTFSSPSPDSSKSPSLSSSTPPNNPSSPDIPLSNHTFSSTDTYYSSDSNEGQSLKCDNCRRKDIPQLRGIEKDIYGLQFQYHIRKNLIARRKYRCVPVSKSGETADDVVTLCLQCSAFLSSKKGDTFANIWPGFLWKLLTNNEVNTKYPNHAWAFIPEEWRFWWRDYLDGSEPGSFFVDRTLDQFRMKQEIDSGMLSRIRDTTNELLLPTVLCPWGGSEYINRCGTLPIDLIIQR